MARKGTLRLAQERIASLENLSRESSATLPEQQSDKRNLKRS
jgi:hypothetical protein